MIVPAPPDDLGELKLEWLRGWVHVAEAGGFTAGARRAGISQPALHTQVGQLARWAGEPLYLRDGRRLNLTPRGQEVLRLARAVLAEIGRFQADARAEPVTLSAGRATHLYLLAEPLRRWVGEGGALRLRSESGEEALQSVLEGRAQLAVAPLPRPDPRLRSARLRVAGVVAVLRRDDPLSRARALTLAELSERELLLPPPARPLRLAVDAAFADRGLSPRVGLELEGWDLLVHYASLGVGVALVNDYVPLPEGAVGVPVPELPRVELRVLALRGVQGPARTLYDRLVGP